MLMPARQSEGDGPGGAFEDPETSPVEGFSSRGPCLVNGETRSEWKHALRGGFVVAADPGRLNDERTAITASSWGHCRW